jgi:para-aminobenzoate synthetase component I
MLWRGWQIRMSYSRFELPYENDSAKLFARIKHMHWPMMLDSGQVINPQTQLPGSQFGRFDILVANPVTTFVTIGTITTVVHQGAQTKSKEDPFSLVKKALKLTPAKRGDIPFKGGALGYFAYDLGRRVETIPSIAENDTHMPEMMVGIYDWAVIVDHREKKTQLVSNLFYTSDDEWKQLCDLLILDQDEQAPSIFSASQVVSNFTELTYQQAFEQVKRYIENGDCYQVNLAQRLSADVDGDSWVCYQKLRELSPAPFMAYMDLSYSDQQSIQVLSASPERFLQLIDRSVETRPIKGTRPRLSDPKQDLGSAIELLTSAKDRAENVMIVDLLRNDIGKVCEVGSVKAEKLFNLQSFANVHHLVSFVTGKLANENTALDLLRSCFPGGSITGAPKLRAMEIIEELEPHRRGVYCGAIGYIGFDGDMDTNITIRTAVVMNGHIYFYAGGGVVADSTLEKEYKETLDKASNFLTTMQYFMRN